jgi:O-antigen/teichoic acid export membrane protein
MESGAAAAEARRYGKTAGLLSAAIGTGGLLTYLYFAIASHLLSRADYGAIVVLWASAVLTVSVFHRPVEQLVSRTVAERQALGLPIGRPVRIAAMIQLGIATTSALVAIALRGPIQDHLLDGSSSLYWILVVTIVGYAGSYFARGFLAGTRRFGLLGGLIFSEASIRVLFPIAVAVGITSGKTAIAVGTAAGASLCLLIIPVALAVERHRGTEPAMHDGPAPTEAPPGRDFTFARGGTFALSVLMIMLSEQTFMNGGPLLVRGAEGAAQAGFIFNVIMVARAPLLLFQGVATSLLPHLTRLRSAGSREGDDAFRLSVQGTLRAIAVFSAGVVVVLMAAGPKLMQIAFGNKFTYDRPALLMVAVGMGLYLAATTLNQASVAQGQVRRASMRWIACAAAFVVWNFLPFFNHFRRVEIGFVGAAAVLCALLLHLYLHPVARPGDEVEPGSAREVGATLAAAEEAG